MTFSYHPDARSELDEATNYYDQVDPALGDHFLEEIDDCVSRVLNFPHSWLKLRGDVRRCRTHRFPYSVIYQVEAEHVFILAVMHSSRKPNYWAYRLRDE